ncbi:MULTISPECIES: peptidylprolyl isomerase [Thermus]|jgi:peptidyl-prolyl cis-trans isomerase C|uniref:Peptidyl-prolyl cis-trans isomerase n=1 Tax=Thermus brockianus TaxID=56956 RepID=A0A1J0LT41_THEBO|nr:peptidylprolyl isomerase [Thermus brockianus]APD08607.1 peptidyl-prolyl cis-trans isomerase [Thermus brockianus]BDG16038.1 peptidylprolyl isomerase [Thermus brockianus]
MRAFLVALALLTPLALAQEDPVVAQVGTETLTKSQFDLRFGLFAKSALRQLGLPDTEETRALLAQYRPQYLEALAEERALLQVAKAQGFWPRPEAVEARVQALMEAFPDENALAEALKGAGLPDLATYRLLLAEALALEALEGHYREKLQVSPAALKALWLLSPEYRHETLYCARHILLPTLEEAREALGRLEKGEPFAQVAQALSQDPGSKEAGGALGCEPQGTYIPAFESALLRLKPGEVSGPVGTPFGFHVILLEAVKPAGRYPLEEVAEELALGVKDRAWEKLAKALTRPYPIRLFPERL